MKDYSNLEHAEYPVSEKSIKFCEEMLGLRFGRQLVEYLTNYGYLAAGDIEFYGISGGRGPTSDMVVQTSQLHIYHPHTAGCVVFEALGDGAYVMVRPDDSVVRYDSDTGALTELGKCLNEYIESRLAGD